MPEQTSDQVKRGLTLLKYLKLGFTLFPQPS